MRVYPRGIPKRHLEEVYTSWVTGIPLEWHAYLLGDMHTSWTTCVKWMLSMLSKRYRKCNPRGMCVYPRGIPKRHLQEVYTSWVTGIPLEWHAYLLGDRYTSWETCVKWMLSMLSKRYTQCNPRGMRVNPRGMDVTQDIYPRGIPKVTCKGYVYMRRRTPPNSWSSYPFPNLGVLHCHYWRGCWR